MKAISAAVAGLCLSMVASVGSAATVVLTTTNDGTVQNTNGDGTVFSAVDDFATVTATSVNGRSVFAIFEFDLSSILDASTINSASFAFTPSGAPSSVYNDPVPFAVEAYLGDGAITASDFNQVGVQVVSGAILKSAAIGTPISFALSNLSPVQNALATNLLTLRLSVPGANDQVRIGFLDSLTTSSPYSAATLTLDATPIVTQPPSAVPLPAGLPLLLAGLGALGIMRRKQR